LQTLKVCITVQQESKKANEGDNMHVDNNGVITRSRENKLTKMQRNFLYFSLMLLASAPASWLISSDLGATLLIVSVSIISAILFKRMRLH
jgi:hypothetical protein